MDTLELKLKKRAGGGGATEREYYDFVINGKSIAEMIDVDDKIGVLIEGEVFEKEKKKFVDQLLLKFKSDLESNRIPLYVCPECADVLEGTITINISEDETSVMWSDFAYEHHYGEEMFEKYDIGPFRFDKIEYFNLLKKFIEN